MRLSKGNVWTGIDNRWKAKKSTIERTQEGLSEKYKQAIRELVWGVLNNPDDPTLPILDKFFILVATKLDRWDPFRREIKFDKRISYPPAVMGTTLYHIDQLKKTNTQTWDLPSPETLYADLKMNDFGVVDSLKKAADGFYERAREEYNKALLGRDDYMSIMKAQAQYLKNMQAKPPKPPGRPLIGATD